MVFNNVRITKDSLQHEDHNEMYGIDAGYLWLGSVDVPPLTDATGKLVQLPVGSHTLKGKR